MNSVVTWIREMQRLDPLISNLSQQSHDATKRLEKLYSPIKNDDTRVCILAKICNLMNASKFGVIGLQLALQANRNNEMFTRPKPDGWTWVQQFDSNLRSGILMGAFSCVESSWRIILRVLHKSCGQCGTPCKECKGGLAGFWKLRSCLLSELGLDKADAGQRPRLLQLLTNIRNAVHNNFVFYPDKENPKDETIEFDGVKYEFTVGKPIDFVSWDFVLMATWKLNDLAEEVSSNHKIHALPYMPDPGVI